MYVKICMFLYLSLYLTWKVRHLDNSWACFILVLVYGNYENSSFPPKYLSAFGPFNHPLNCSVQKHFTIGKNPAEYL